MTYFRDFFNFFWKKNIWDIKFFVECKTIILIHSFHLLFVVGDEFACDWNDKCVSSLDSIGMCDVFAVTYSGPGDLPCF